MFFDYMSGVCPKSWIASRRWVGSEPYGHRTVELWGGTLLASEKGVSALEMLV